VPELDLFPVDDDWWRIRHDVQLPESPRRRRWRYFLSFAFWCSLGLLVPQILPRLWPASSDWDFVVIGILMFVPCVLLPILILVIGFHGRRRTRAILRERLLYHGVPVCLSCGYCLRGSPADAQRCPECGQPIQDRVRALMRDTAESNC
jgi:predicted RNA-binding Zn-ribbon protein involved in translation (DUF1610 family)